jgi:hypothetical protein
MHRWAYGDDGDSNVPLLDDYHKHAATLCGASLVASARAPDDAQHSGPVLHERIHLIWKFPQFCTACVRKRHRAIRPIRFVSVLCRLNACHGRPAPRCAAGTTRTRMCGRTLRFTTRSLAHPCFILCPFSSVRSFAGSSVCAHTILQCGFTHCIACRACAQGSTSHSWGSTTVPSRCKSSCSPLRSGVSRSACGCRCDTDCIISHPQELHC